MGAWLLKITGVIALSTLSSLLIPNGQTKKNTSKGIFRAYNVVCSGIAAAETLKKRLFGFSERF
ncbi:MAG: hypothetical protein L6V79_04760 [Clostridium sp.]|nr:MAG: hypothetical protein L6V79_04760 [Clostridium sp.]